MKTRGQELIEELLLHAAEGESLGGVDVAADTVMIWMDGAASTLSDRALLIDELRRVLDPKSRVPEMDNRVLEEILRRLGGHLRLA